MNRLTLVTVLFFFAMIICISCGKEPKDENNHCPCIEREEPSGEGNFTGIENISFENYPRVDGSTSTQALNMMVACKLLGVQYTWMSLVQEAFVQPYLYTEQVGDFFAERIRLSQTNGAFMNLIDGNADIILTHRTISPDEKAHADAVGVTLIETSIALDAFVFVVNKDNPVQSLTVDQIQKIYTKEITNWSQVGGNNAAIGVFTRPRNSGSEEVFRTVVMNGLEPADFPEAAIGLMAWVFAEVMNNQNSICYSFQTYKDMQARIPCNEVPVIAINDICPSESTIKNRTYPFIAEVHVAIRSDLDPNSMAYKLYEWLQSENAQPALIECGFFTK